MAGTVAAFVRKKKKKYCPTKGVKIQVLELNPANFRQSKLISHEIKRGDQNLNKEKWGKIISPTLSTCRKNTLLVPGRCSAGLAHSLVYVGA